MGRGGLRYSEGCMNLRNLRNERKKVAICYWTCRLNLTQRHVPIIWENFLLIICGGITVRVEEKEIKGLKAKHFKLVEFIYLIRKKVCPFIIMSKVFRNRTFKRFRVWSLPQKKLHPFHMRTWMHPSLTKLCNQVRSLDHFVVQNSGDFLCWKYKEVVSFYVSNLLQ